MKSAAADNMVHEALAQRRRAKAREREQVEVISDEDFKAGMTMLYRTSPES